MHPFDSKIYFVNNNNNIFYFCLKTNSTFKLDIGEKKMPKNIQVFNLCFSLVDFNEMVLIGDYHLIFVNLNGKIGIEIVKKENRIINIHQIIDSKSNFI